MYSELKGIISLIFTYFVPTRGHSIYASLLYCTYYVVRNLFFFLHTYFYLVYVCNCWIWKVSWCIANVLCLTVYDVILNEDFNYFVGLYSESYTIQAWFNFPLNLFNNQGTFSLGHVPRAAYFGCNGFTLSVHSAPTDKVKIIR